MVQILSINSMHTYVTNVLTFYIHLQICAAEHRFSDLDKTDSDAILY